MGSTPESQQGEHNSRNGEPEPIFQPYRLFMQFANRSIHTLDIPHIIASQAHHGGSRTSVYTQKG